MARQEIIELILKTDKAVSQVESLQSEIKDLKNEVKTSTDKATKGFEDMNKASKGLAGGIKSVGLALKAAGIGLAIAAFNGLKDVIGASQEVTDFFNTSVESMKIGFSKFAKKFEDDSGSMFATWDTFTSSIADGAKKIKNNLVDQLSGQFDLVAGNFKRIILEMRIAWNEFTGDTEEAESLTKDLDAATKQMTDGYKKMMGAVEEANNAVKSFVTDIAESVTETYEQAKANVELAKQAEIAAVKQQGLIEKYDIQAEQLRQIRDNEFKTIEERIQANNDLKDVLDKQEKAMLRQVNIQIRQAQEQYNLNDNQENYIALLEARNEKQAVLAQIEGFRSEQDSNANALLREKIELEQSVIDGIDERKIAEAEFTASLEDDIIKRLQLERDAIDLEEELGVERLTNQRDQYEKGTQAFVDANEELLNFQQEINFKRLENQKNLNDELIKEEQRVGDEMVKLFFDAQSDLLDYAEKTTEARIKLQDTLVNATSSSLQSIAQLAGEGTKIAKAAALADIIISTGVGFAQGLDIAQKSAKGTGPAAAIAFPVFYATQVAAVLSAAAQAKNVLSKVKGPSGGIPTSGPTVTTPPTQPTAPQFNIVGQSGINQVAQALGQQQPVQAYVVAQDVTTAQQLNNNIISAATVGG